MGLHRKSYYRKRRKYIKQPFEVQEREQRRVDYVLYVVVAVPMLCALVHSVFIKNYGMAVFFASSLKFIGSPRKKDGNL